MKEFHLGKKNVEKIIKESREEFKEKGVERVGGGLSAVDCTFLH